MNVYVSLDFNSHLLQKKDFVSWLYDFVVSQEYLHNNIFSMQNLYQITYELYAIYMSVPWYIQMER